MHEEALPTSTEFAGSAGVLSISELNRSVRDLLEHRFPLTWVKGEISNSMLARSGHYYFSLKDDEAQVRCVMFRHRGQHLDFVPRDGMRVEVRALVTLYEPRGDFQLNVETMRPAGLGALFEAFMRLRQQLEREGLFDAAAKRPLPRFPRAIGIVTSPQAAALRDVLATLARRNPSVPAIIYPAQVQGTDAPATLIDALTAAGRRSECDVIILCRGGGSIEDLWAFNDEALARAIRACPIPVVTGIGHETDFTIADFAADARAATPTAAAELVSPLAAELRGRISSLAQQLQRTVMRRIDTQIQILDHLSRRLVHPRGRIDAQSQHFVHLQRRLAQAALQSLDRHRWRVTQLIERARGRLPSVAVHEAHVAELRTRVARGIAERLRQYERDTDARIQSLAHLDPSAVLARGYSVTRNAAGEIVRSGSQVSPGEMVDVTLAEGGIAARVEQTRR